MRLTINPRIKNFLWGIFAIAIIIAFVVWSIANPDPGTSRTQTAQTTFLCR